MKIRKRIEFYCSTEDYILLSDRAKELDITLSALIRLILKKSIAQPTISQFPSLERMKDET